MEELEQGSEAVEKDMFDVLVDDWRAHLLINTAHTTIGTYLRHVHYFGKYLRGAGLPRDPSVHTYKTIDAYMVHLRERPNERTGEPLSDTYRISQFRSLEQFYRWLTREEEIEVNPFEKATAPEAAQRLVPIVTDADLIALVSTCKGNTFEQRRDEAIIRFLNDSGPRSAELTALETEGQLGKAPGLVPAQNCAWLFGKGGKWRLVPYGLRTAESLRRYIRRRNQHSWAHRSRALWLGKSGPMTASGIDQMVERRCLEAEIEVINLHKFRHTWAHNLRKSGEVGDAEMMYLGGWSSRQMLELYGRSGVQDRAIQAHHRAARGDRI